MLLAADELLQTPIFVKANAATLSQGPLPGCRVDSVPAKTKNNFESVTTQCRA